MKLTNVLIFLFIASFVIFFPQVGIEKEFIFYDIEEDVEEEEGVKVRIKGATYLIVKPWNIIDNKNKLARYHFERNSDNEDILVVINQDGKLIRNVNLIWKAFLTSEYSQLDDEEIDELLDFPDDVDDLFDEFDENNDNYSPQYVDDLYISLCFFKTTKPKNLLKYSNYCDSNTIARIITGLKKNPVLTYNILLMDVIFNCQQELKQISKKIKKNEDKVISFRDSLHRYKMKVILMYCNAISSLSNNYPLFENATIKNKGKTKNKSKNKSKNNLPLISSNANSKNNNKLSLKSSFDQAHDLLFEALKNEKSFVKLNKSINRGFKKLLKEENEILEDAVLSATYFPIYGFSEGEYDLPKKLKNKYKAQTVLFYDDFDSDLDRNWELHGNPKPVLTVSKKKRKSKKSCLNTNGDDLFYSSVCSKNMFNACNGVVNIEVLFKSGKGKGNFGFGSYIINDALEKGVEPIIGFVINHQRTGSISFIVNDEVVINKSHSFDLSKKVKLNLILSYDKGVNFKVNGNIVYSSDYKVHNIGSESVVISSTSDDFLWEYILITQQKDAYNKLSKSQSILGMLGFIN